jgi:hypothetical protein
MASVVFQKGVEQCGRTEFLANTIRAMLLKDTFTPNKDMDFVDDGTANDPASHEVSHGSYARQTLTGKTYAVNDAQDRVEIKSDTIDFGALTGVSDARYLCLFMRVGADDTTPGDDVLLAALDFGSNQVANGAGFTVPCPSAGWYYLAT